MAANVLRRSVRRRSKLNRLYFSWIVGVHVLQSIVIVACGGAGRVSPSEKRAGERNGGPRSGIFSRSQLHTLVQSRVKMPLLGAVSAHSPFGVP